MTLSRKHLWFAGTALAVLALDLGTKALITANLEYRDGFVVIPGFFNIVHARNPGAAFGFLRDADAAWTVPFFLIVGTIAIGFLLTLLRKLPDHLRMLPVILGAIAGGAVGNISDRVRYGYVVDFLDLYVGRYHWPAFNVADMGISVGVAVLLFLSITGRDEHLFDPPGSEQ